MGLDFGLQNDEGEVGHEIMEEDDFMHHRSKENSNNQPFEEMEDEVDIDKLIAE